MSLIRYDSSGPSDIVVWGIDIASTLLYYAHIMYYWLWDIAPIIIKYKLKQMGRRAVDDLPLLSWETKQEIKQWLHDYFGL